MTDCRVARRDARAIAPVFELIADIESYPRFMPGWREARIIGRAERRHVVWQTVSLAGIRVGFVSAAAIDRPHHLEIRSDEAPFRAFRLLWTLTEVTAAETVVLAEMSVAFRARPLDGLAARLLPGMLARTIEAFTREAARLPPLQPNTQAELLSSR